MNNPEFIIVNNKKIKINTDYRIALECQRIALDDEISDYERTLAIIYKLFGKEALRDEEHIEEYLNKASKFLKCNQEGVGEETGEPTFDYEQDWGYIQASFMSDYQIDLDKVKMHWWTFFNLLNGLTDKCILNRVRQIRSESLSGKKGKELNEWIKAKESVKLKHKKSPQEKRLDEWWEKTLRGE